MIIGEFFRALVGQKRRPDMPPDLQAFEEARNELGDRIDAFGAMVKGMRASSSKRPAVATNGKTRKK